MKKPYRRPEIVTVGPYMSAEKRSRMEAMLKRLGEAFAEGLTLTLLAERFGVHRNTVGKYLGKLGLVEQSACSCGRSIRGTEPRCYICRGLRPSGANAVARTNRRANTQVGKSNDQRTAPAADE